MEYNQVVRKAQRRFRFAIANRMFLYALAGELFIVGTAVAVLRLYYPVVFSSHPYVVWGTALGLAALIPLVTYWLAGRFVPSQTSVRAWLDNQFSCGGVMSAEEYFPEAKHWEKKETAVEIHSKLGELIPFRIVKPLFICLLSTIFVTCALLVPIPAAAPSTTTAYIEKDAERIANKIELLKKEKTLSEQQAEQMLQTLNRLSEESDGTDPLHTFEALDALENLLDQTAQDAARQAEKNAQSAQDAQDLSEAMKNDWDKLNDAQKTAAAKELQKMLDQMNGKGSENQNSLDADGQENSGENGDFSEENASGEGAPEGDESEQSSEPNALQLPENVKIPDLSQLTPEQLEKLKNQLKEYQGDLQELLEKLKEGQFGDLDQLQIEPSDEDIDPESLLLFLDENCPDGDCEQGIQLWLQQGRRGGRGGQSHGDAPPTPLQFDDNPPDDNPDFDKFKPEQLPTHVTRQAVEQSQLRGVTLGDASKEQLDSTDELQGKVIDPNEQDGGIGRTQKVYPMHRRSVEGYFDSGIAPRGAHRP